MTHEHEQDEVPTGALDGEGTPAVDQPTLAEADAVLDAPTDSVPTAPEDPAEPDPDVRVQAPLAREPEPENVVEAAPEALAAPTRASRRAQRRRPAVVPAFAAAAALTALSFSGYQTFTAVTSLSMGPQGARAVLVGQTIALLLLAVAAIGGVLLADRRAAIAAQNPTMDALQGALADAERANEAIAASRDSAVSTAEDLRTRLGHEEARVEAAAAAVRTAEAVRDQARADLQRYLDQRPPSAEQIRQQVAEEIQAAQQSALADLHQAHQRVVTSLQKRIVDAEGAADRAREAAAIAEASVTAEREKTRAEERTRMRITVQALSEADVAAVHGEEGAVAVAEFAARFVAAVERLNPEIETTPPRPVRALASSRGPAASDEASDKGTKRRRRWGKP